jgi:hypothetical protein
MRSSALGTCFPELDAAREILPAIHGVKVLKWIKVLRLFSSAFIIIGAAVKIMRWDYGDIFLMIGIGSMATYSSLLAYVAKTKQEHNPEIIDDI